MTCLVTKMQLIYNSLPNGNAVVFAYFVILLIRKVFIPNFKHKTELFQKWIQFIPLPLKAMTPSKIK